MRLRSQRRRQGAALLLVLLAACHKRSEPSEPRAVAVDRDASLVWLAADASLPALSSGYELYAWQVGEALHFALIDFRDRVKSVDELVSELPDHQDGSSVHVRGRGLPALQDALARIPPQSSVILESLPSLPAVSAESQAEILRLLLARSAVDAGAARSAEKLCTDTGGRAETSYCCMSSGAFPSTCSIGPCGCSPERSKLTPYCVCAEGQCFDERLGCRPRESARSVR